MAGNTPTGHGSNDTPVTSSEGGISQTSRSLPTKSWSSSGTHLMEGRSKCSSCDSSHTDRSHAWSLSGSHDSTAASSHSSLSYHHDPQSPELQRSPIAATFAVGSQHIYAALAENEALRDSIVELEREKARLQEILKEHTTQQQRDPDLCRYLSPGKAQSSAPQCERRQKDEPR